MTRNPVQDGDFVLAPLFGSLMNAHGAEGVLNGIAPSVGTGDWDVDTSAGDVFINNTTQAVSSTTTTLTAPSSDADLDSGEFRVDLLTADSTGSINVAEGVAATEPITEDIPTDEAVVCAVVVSGDASSLQSADIYDYRTLLESDKDRYVDGGPHEIDAQEFAGDDGSDNQYLRTNGANASWESVPNRTLHWAFTSGSGLIQLRDADLRQFSSGVFRVRFRSDDGSTATVDVTSQQSATTIESVSTTSGSFTTVEDTTLTIPGDDLTDVTLGTTSNVVLDQASIHLRGQP